MHRSAALFHVIILLDDDVVEESPPRPNDLRDGFAEEGEVVLFQPLVIEATGKLDRLPATPLSAAQTTSYSSGG
jgi:hypothetical protein